MNTTELLESIRQRASLPSSGASGTDADSLLRYADEELLTRLVPHVLKVREDHFVVTEDTALVADKARYRIPSRAIGGKLRDLLLVDGDSVSNLVRIPPEDADAYAASGTPEAFYMEGSSVVLVPAPSSSSQSLRMRYHRRPGKLVASDEAALIVAKTSTTVTLAGTPALWSASSTVDFVKGTSGFECAAVNVGVATLAADVLTPDDPDTLEDVEVGDYVTLAGYSFFPQVPEDLHPVLAQLVACTVLDAIGDGPGLERALVKLRELQEASGVLLSNRVEGEAKIINTRNGFLGGGGTPRIWGR